LLVRQWGERFRRDPLASGVVADLRRSEIWHGTVELMQREPDHRHSVDEEFTQGSTEPLQRTAEDDHRGRGSTDE
jgi:hypothetical protein